MRALCGLNVIPHWLNTSSTLAVQKIFNGNKYITPKYKYKYKYFTYKYKYQVPHLWAQVTQTWPLMGVFTPSVCRSLDVIGGGRRTSN